MSADAFSLANAVMDPLMFIKISVIPSCAGTCNPESDMLTLDIFYHVFLQGDWETIASSERN
jgi:hypothetical protein